MKSKRFWLFSLALAAAIGGGKVAQCATGKLVPIKLTRHIFVPVGFDDRNEIIVVLDGFLPDPCHQLRHTQVKIDADANKAILTPMAEVFDGYCPDVTVPFQQVVSLGSMKAGAYTVELFDGSHQESLGIKVAIPKPTSDDYLYAPIDSAQVLFGQDGSPMAVLKGRFTSTCLVKDEIKVTDHEKTIEVLPIMKKLARNAFGQPCETTERDFVWTVTLPKSSEEAGRHLLHVRSLNGQSVNEVFSGQAK
jgi:hypothetical protein